MEKYINRELSWLEFNARVLDEAADVSTPLLERAKFLAIFSSNLDEFFMVRVAGVRQQLAAGENPGYDPAELLEQLRQRIRTLTTRQYKYLNREIIPALAKNTIKIKKFRALPQDRQGRLKKYFMREIQPTLTPIGIDQSHPFPQLKNTGLELLIRLYRAEENMEHFAIVEVPSLFPRFINVENSGDEQVFITAEDLIAENLDSLFGGCRIMECAPFRITRDMDFLLDEDKVGDMMNELRVELQKTLKRKIIRLEVSSRMTKKSRLWLEKNLDVTNDNVYSISGILDLTGLFSLIGSCKAPQLLDKELPSLPSVHINRDENIIDALRRNGSFMLHHPYESFSPVVRLLEECAIDPDVLAIKQTLYRVSGNSPIIKELIKAARNGKQVTVLIELKARFDEENNIVWARELENAGAHVIYGIAGLKVHCKALLIIRREGSGIKRYVHLSTGNYNDKTAKLYTDLGMFSDDDMLSSDISALFNVITGFSKPPAWAKIMVAPFTLRERLKFLIRREVNVSTKQNPGHIIMKVNSLIDSDMIDCLYEAASKNVKIELIVRGVCGINPAAIGNAGKNIKLLSILDRFLEHSRIYYFRNNGMEEYYIGSADVMPRNLDRRIELLFPVDKEELQKELSDILHFCLRDKRKGRRLLGANKYSRTVRAQKYENSRSQTAEWEYYNRRYENHLKEEKAIGELKVFKKPQNIT